MRSLIQPQVFDALLGVITLFAAFASFHLARLFLRQGVVRLLSRTEASWDDMLVKSGVFEKIGWLAPALVIYASVLYFAPAAEKTIIRLLYAYSIGVSVLFIDSALTAINDIYGKTKTARDLPIKGYLQVVKLIAYLAGGLVVIAILLKQSPWVFLSGLGAATAVLVLIFKDTLLSFVASVQLATNDMIRLGDWIEAPKFDADGEVIDIALHTVKIQNWDLTITTIPTFKLIEDSFKNWRGMKNAGARRIKRSVNLDVSTISFGEGRLTNVARFRIYLEEWLRQNPLLRKDMSIVVRQLQSGQFGLPIEIYAFTSETRWAEYEALQADIFEHIFAVAPEFGLRIFQAPSAVMEMKVRTPGSIPPA